MLGFLGFNFVSVFNGAEMLPGIEQYEQEKGGDADGEHAYLSLATRISHFDHAGVINCFMKIKFRRDSRHRTAHASARVHRCDHSRDAHCPSRHLRHLNRFPPVHLLQWVSLKFCLGRSLLLTCLLFHALHAVDQFFYRQALKHLFVLIFSRELCFKSRGGAVKARPEVVAPKLEGRQRLPGIFAALACLPRSDKLQTQTLSAARSFALRDLGLRSISSSAAVTGFFVSTV